MTKAEIIALAERCEVNAEVRYWEDASVNGIEDTDGTLIPGREGNAWRIQIDLARGAVEEWPQGTEASIHYKVCDHGLYWLTDASGRRIAKWKGDYVPDEFLCHGDSGYGDYIIFDVGPNGSITGYQRPEIDPERWDWAIAEEMD